MTRRNTEPGTTPLPEALENISFEEIDSSIEAVFSKGTLRGTDEVPGIPPEVVIVADALMPGATEEDFDTALQIESREAEPPVMCRAVAFYD